MTDLFQRGPFALHSGDISPWKIECDALSNDEIDTLASMLIEMLPEFGKVVGVPRGGLRLAAALAHHTSVGPLLIVDDVLSTGASMDEARSKLEDYDARTAIGAVIFARALCPAWITPLFAMPASIGQAKLAYRLYSALRPIVEAAEEATDSGTQLMFFNSEFIVGRSALDAYDAMTL